MIQQIFLEQSEGIKYISKKKDKYCLKAIIILKN